MYRKSIRTKRLEAKRKRCAAMRAAKERKRAEAIAKNLPPETGTAFLEELE